MPRGKEYIPISIKRTTAAQIKALGRGADNSYDTILIMLLQAYEEGRLSTARKEAQ